MYEQFRMLINFQLEDPSVTSPCEGVVSLLLTVYVQAIYSSFINGNHDERQTTCAQLFECNTPVMKAPTFPYSHQNSFHAALLKPCFLIKIKRVLIIQATSFIFK